MSWIFAKLLVERIIREHCSAECLRTKYLSLRWFCPFRHPQVDLTFKKPVLNLNLYDTTGEEDIFINQVLVDTGIAVFVEGTAQETG